MRKCTSCGDEVHDKITVCGICEYHAQNPGTKKCISCGERKARADRCPDCALQMLRLIEMTHAEPKENW